MFSFGTGTTEITVRVKVLEMALVSWAHFQVVTIPATRCSMSLLHGSSHSAFRVVMGYEMGSGGID